MSSRRARTASPSCATGSPTSRRRRHLESDRSAGDALDEPDTRVTSPVVRARGPPPGSRAISSRCAVGGPDEAGTPCASRTVALGSEGSMKRECHEPQQEDAQSYAQHRHHPSPRRRTLARRPRACRRWLQHADDLPDGDADALLFVPRQLHHARRRLLSSSRHPGTAPACARETPTTLIWKNGEARTRARPRAHPHRRSCCTPSYKSRATDGPRPRSTCVSRVTVPASGRDRAPEASWSRHVCRCRAAHLAAYPLLRINLVPVSRGMRSRACSAWCRAESSSATTCWPAAEGPRVRNCSMQPRVVRGCYTELVVPGMLVYVAPERLARLRGNARERWTIRRGELLDRNLLQPDGWTLYVATLRDDRAWVIAYLEHVETSTSRPQPASVAGAPRHRR